MFEQKGTRFIWVFIALGIYDFGSFFQKLQEKLDNNGGSEDHNHHQLFVPSLDGHHADSGRLPSLLSNNNSTSHFDENLVENQANGASRDSQHLPTDTIVLVGSLIVMIFIGLHFLFWI